MAISKVLPVAMFDISTTKYVIILDEAGLVSTRQMDVFLKMTKKNNTRVIFVGDTRQHNSVEGGDALRLIEDYSVIDKVSLSKVKRQRHHQYKEAIQKLAEGDIRRGFSFLDGMGAIKESKSKTRYELIAKEYLEAVKSQIDTLIVSPTNREIEVINSVVRGKLKEAGLIDGEDQQLKVYKSLNLTTAEKSYYGNYEVGQVLSFHKTLGEFKQGEVMVVQELKENKLIAQDQNGKILEVNPVQHQSLYDVVGEPEKQFARGDKIIIKANYATSPTNRIPNGTIATIDSINLDGSITLKNGKVLGENFRQFDHAYAITSQASQGKTAEKVILSARSKSGMALSRNQFYVTCSRGRDSVSIHTDNKSELLKTVTKSSARRLVIEELVRDRIVMKAALQVNVAIERAIEKSLDLIEKAFVKYGDRELADDNLREKDTTILKDTNQPDKA
jgi:ATP-dependent exoDNAse (exonuclease V) alpha subunit